MCTCQVRIIGKGRLNKAFPATCTGLPLFSHGEVGVVLCRCILIWLALHNLFGVDAFGCPISHRNDEYAVCKPKLIITLSEYQEL